MSTSRVSSHVSTSDLLVSLQKLQDACVICKNLIKGDCVELAGKTYHPECCKCQICGETVRGKYFVHDGLPICEKDFKVRKT